MNSNRKIILITAVISISISGSIAAFAESQKKTDDSWNWVSLGSVDNHRNMFPNTQVDKFRDERSGVICYWYHNMNVDAKNIETDGKTRAAVAGDQLGTLSCVPERR